MESKALRRIARLSAFFVVLRACFDGSILRVLFAIDESENLSVFAPKNSKNPDSFLGYRLTIKQLKYVTTVLVYF